MWTLSTSLLQVHMWTLSSGYFIRDIAWVLNIKNKLDDAMPSSVASLRVHFGCHLCCIHDSKAGMGNCGDQVRFMCTPIQFVRKAFHWPFRKFSRVGHPCNSMHMLRNMRIRQRNPWNEYLHSKHPSLCITGLRISFYPGSIHFYTFNLEGLFLDSH